MNLLTLSWSKILSASPLVQNRNLVFHLSSRSIPCLYYTICISLSKHLFCIFFIKIARLTHHYYNIFMGNPLTSSKDLSISLLKLLECRMQWYIDFITWTSRPYFRLITGSSFTVFVLCRLNHIRCIRVTHSSLNR